ncbi:pyrroline-5-carboxylate reductase [Undibacterium sp. TS12]|uniref:pyrroline-5-carboxylate reductase n=1 Tax=Undibacterium sp. TS12 TaxID=2908202 RepID=UPI001F4CF6F5|nr:pyrroline-5-carboxylate reductase [Undibacterium sp. TS12]MCH8620093.1 pyrroline-5-carboxylate reductase [Undibacterium sp. TS12]
MQNKLNIAFIGGGNMANALIGGLLKSLTSAEHIHVVDLNQQSLQKLRADFGVSTALAIDSKLAEMDAIILAVKPQQLREVITSLAPHLGQQLLISIAAGIRAVDMARWLNGYEKIVRTMPNTPALIGQGMTGLFALPAVTDSQKQMAEQIMQAVGATTWLTDESLIDAVTAVSGSGPAYVFYFIEAMQQAATELGLTAEQGLQLAMTTFNGATQLAMQSAEPVATLRERVTSKGGTTYAALTSMEAAGVRQAIVDAVKAAAARGKELGDEFGQQA